MSKQLVESSKGCVLRSDFRKPLITLLFRFKTEKRGVSPFFVYFLGPAGGLLSLPPPEGFPVVEGKPADPLPPEIDLLILLFGLFFVCLNLVQMILLCLETNLVFKVFTPGTIIVWSRLFYLLTHKILICSAKMEDQKATGKD